MRHGGDAVTVLDSRCYSYSARTFAHCYFLSDLQQQVNAFNRGVSLDGSQLEGIETPFSYGMACYPEKHEEAPNMESDIRYAK